jgi:signal transduction histidine kinase/ActR/RegA family two-component response regulator
MAYLRKRLPLILGAVLVIALITGLYIRQLNKTISDNTIQNISELAQHDLNTIRKNVEKNWQELEYLESKFAGYQCKTMDDMEKQMNMECATSDFSHIYLVGKDGKVYTDKFVKYDPETDGQNGGIDFLPYFSGESDRIVSRYNDTISTEGYSKESILYGLKLDSFWVGNLQMVGLVGITDINNIQDQLVIGSFEKDGEMRGYSAVIDADGNYIVDVDRSVYSNDNNNFFDRLDSGKKTDITSEKLVKKMLENENITFYATNEAGVDHVIYCTPFEETEIPWYFLMSVETTVFSDQNKSFLTMSLGMLVAIILVIIGVLSYVVVSQKKIIMVNAKAEARSAFLANMSHEIRTPLNGIIGLVYLMEKDLNNDEDREVLRQRLEKTEETAEYLLALINNILDISKFQSGEININNEVISPELIADAVWSIQKSNVEKKGIEFILEKDIDVPWIVGDELKIKQVLLNIVSNAAKFTAEGGRITLSVRQNRTDDDQVTTEFICEDNGCGMSASFLEHIWDSFSQERGNNTDSIKGTGLGMAISKLLVDAMDGDIEVESTPGKGSRFSVRIYSQVVDRADDDIPKENGVTNDDKRLKILVAEDNELNAEILVEILACEGFETVLAGDGQEAVDIFKNSQIDEFDLILMDMQMPVKDGCQATEEIRHLDRRDAKTIPIFACTANTFNEDREKAEICGMNAFLSKPIDVSELLKVIKTQGT